MLAVVVALALGAVACTDDPQAGPGDGPTVTAATGSGPASTTSVVIVGEPINRYTLAMGDCFSTYVVGTDVITTKLRCEDPHEREVFSTHVHPAKFGDPWPGEEALQKYAVRLCYQDFAAFTGVIYELSELVIGAVTPPQANWEDPRARYRGIQCYVARGDGKPLVGSMRDKRI